MAVTTYPLDVTWEATPGPLPSNSPTTAPRPFSEWGDAFPTVDLPRGEHTDWTNSTGWSENEGADDPLVIGTFEEPAWRSVWGQITGLPETLPANVAKVELRIEATTTKNVSGTDDNGTQVLFTATRSDDADHVSVLQAWNIVRRLTGSGGDTPESDTIFPSPSGPFGVPTDTFSYQAEIDHDNWGSWDLWFSLAIRTGRNFGDPPPGGFDLPFYESALVKDGALTLVVTTFDELDVTCDEPTALQWLPGEAPNLDPVEPFDVTWSVQRGPGTLTLSATITGPPGGVTVDYLNLDPWTLDVAPSNNFDPEITDLDSGTGPGEYILSSGYDDITFTGDFDATPFAGFSFTPTVTSWTDETSMTVSVAFDEADMPDGEYASLAIQLLGPTEPDDELGVIWTTRAYVLRDCPRDPVALFTMTTATGGASQTFTFDASNSYDPDGGTIVSYEWDFDLSTLFNPSNETGVSFSKTLPVGFHSVRLTVTDDAGGVGVTDAVFNSNASCTVEANALAFGNGVTAPNGFAYFFPSEGGLGQHILKTNGVDFELLGTGLPAHGFESLTLVGDSIYASFTGWGPASNRALLLKVDTTDDTISAIYPPPSMVPEDFDVRSLALMGTELFGLSIQPGDNLWYNHFRLDTTTDTLTVIQKPTGAQVTLAREAAPNGKLYGFPIGTFGPIGVWDPADDTITYESIPDDPGDFPLGITGGSPFAVFVGSDFYVVGGGYWWAKVDTTDDTVTSFALDEVTTPDFNGFGPGRLGSNGKIYAPSIYSTSMLVIDTADDSTEYITWTDDGTETGTGFPYAEVGVEIGDALWLGGTGTASSMLFIDLTNDTAEMVPIAGLATPADFSRAGVVVGSRAFFASSRELVEVFGDGTTSVVGLDLGSLCPEEPPAEPLITPPTTAIFRLGLPEPGSVVKLKFGLTPRDPVEIDVEGTEDALFTSIDGVTTLQDVIDLQG